MWVARQNLDQISIAVIMQRDNTCNSNQPIVQRVKMLDREFDVQHNTHASVQKWLRYTRLSVLKLKSIKFFSFFFRRESRPLPPPPNNSVNLDFPFLSNF